MNSESMHNDLYCGNFEGAISALEQAFEWLKKPASWDNPYSTRFDKEHIYGSRKRELFAVLSLVQKLRKKIQQKIEKDKDEIECTALTRIDAECIMKRTERLILSRDELTTVYRKATMKERPDSITEINRQFETPEERLQQALALVDDMNPLFLMERIFSEVESMRTEIFIHLYPDKIEKCFAAQLLEKEKERVRVSTYPRERLAMTNTFMDKHMPEEAKVTELSLENYISINQDMYDSHQQSLLNNRRYGEQYKTSFRFEWDITDFLAELYHADGSSEILKHIAMMEVCGGEIGDLYIEIQLREYEIQRRIKNTICLEAPDTTQPPKPFVDRLNDAYAMINSDSPTDLCLLHIALYTRRLVFVSKNPALGGDIMTVPSFLNYLGTAVGYDVPDSTKMIEDKFAQFTKPCYNKLKKGYDELKTREELDEYVRRHYQSTNGTKAMKTSKKALALYDVLGE